jgi:hypothetical protein
MKRIVFWFALIALVCLVVEGISLRGLSIIERTGANRTLELSNIQKKTLRRFAFSNKARFRSEEYEIFISLYPGVDEILRPIKIVEGDRIFIQLEMITDDMKKRLGDAFDELMRHTKSGSFSASLGWDTMPNSFQDTPYTATHNSDGIRGAIEYKIPKSNSKIRIAAVGDSFTHGHDVSDTDTWEYKLEGISSNIEVLNFGVGFYGLGQSYLKYKEKVKKYKPDVVLIGYYDDNLLRDVNRFRYFYAPQDPFIPTAPRFKVNEGRLVLIPNPIQDRKDYLRIIMEEKDFLDSIGQDDFFYSRYNYSDISDYSLTIRLLKRVCRTVWRKSHETPIYKNRVYNKQAEPYKVVTAIFDAFYAEVIADKAIPVILIFPSHKSIELYRKKQMRMYQPLLDYLDVKNMQYIDLLDGFNTFGANSDIADFFSWHYTPYGNEIVAKTIKRKLVQRGLISP